METADLSMSIIVPAYNEAGDIRRTLESLVAQRYRAKEIIIVDDCSTDGTPDIVREYRSGGVRLVQTPRRSERCAARNLGIRSARGNVIVILNADVFPEPDFLARIAEHYRRGAEYVLVESAIANTTQLFPRYLEALHRLSYGGQDWVEWTEGFSCLRAAALDVGLFPETPIPLCSGEDGYFGARLARKYRKTIDRSIVVPHTAPETLAPFWGQQVSRGQATPRYFYFLERSPLVLIALRACAKTVVFVLTTSLVVPTVVFSLSLCRHSARGIRDLPGFSLARVLSRLAHVYGEWLGVMDVMRYSWYRGRNADELAAVTPDLSEGRRRR